MDMTYYSYGFELNCEEKGYLVSFIDDVENFKTNQFINPNYTGYVPLVHVLNDDNIFANSMVRFFTIVSLVHLLHTFFLS